MSTDTTCEDLPAMLYRSEAFAEDLEGLLPSPVAFSGVSRRAAWSGWFFVLPAALALLGSASALAWV